MNPQHDPAGEASYTLDIVAEITGVPPQTILHYQQQGLLRPAAYDDDAIHTLRRIEHLRRTCEANLSGLRLILGLMDEVERLRTALRVRR